MESKWNGKGGKKNTQVYIWGTYKIDQRQIRQSTPVEKSKDLKAVKYFRHSNFLPPQNTVVKEVKAYLHISEKYDYDMECIYIYIYT
jgi:hypothetical protein